MFPPCYATRRVPSPGHEGKEKIMEIVTTPEGVTVQMSLAEARALARERSLDADDTNETEGLLQQLLDLVGSGPQRHDNYHAIVAGIHRNLVNFGYTNLQVSEVLASYDKALAGDKAETIIDMMTRSQLEENDLMDIR